MADTKYIEKLLKTWGKEYKKGFTGYFILLFLKDCSMYGFEINKKLMEISDGRIVFLESGIYQTLKKLQGSGMVSSKWEKSDKGPRRRYYRIEEPGERLLELYTKDYILPILNTVTQLVNTHFPGLRQE